MFPLSVPTSFNEGNSKHAVIKSKFVSRGFWRLSGVGGLRGCIVLLLQASATGAPSLFEQKKFQELDFQFFCLGAGKLEFQLKAFFIIIISGIQRKKFQEQKLMKFERGGKGVNSTKIMIDKKSGYQKSEKIACTSKSVSVWLSSDFHTPSS